MLEDLITQFSAETFGEWCREKFDRYTADPHDIQDAGDFSKAAIMGYVQSLPDADTNRPLLVMCVNAGDRISERSSRRRQFDFARRQLQAAIDKPPAKVKGLFTQGLFAFHDDEGNFRLSLVSGRAEGRKLVYSDFKRQSFFVKPDRNNKTFSARMAPPVSTYEQLTAAFSVETLTKEFYNELFAWYERAMDPASKVTFPNDLARDDDDRNLLAEHLIRLITRLMFVWFIRQKDLVPEALFDPAELKKLLKPFDPISAKQDNYYRAILQNLFFATLNCEIKERTFAVEGSREENKEHYGIKTLYRYSDDFACSPEEVIRIYQTVPFLNGGLFECLDKKQEAGARCPVMYHDGFSREPRKCAHIPNNLFFDEHGLITLFARYDFTVDENAPNDTDVALDPELLGKVFENLLGAYNPETKETARKQSGSFYTPREIVNYMVEESLIAHLRKKVPAVDEATLRRLIGGESAPPIPDTQRRALVEAIYHCRILDPACGSGAFPMGLLLKMVHLLQRLDPKNTLWHEVVMAEAEKALAEAENLNATEKRQRRQRITDTFEQNVNQPDYARKLYLIENCIFGVDIQPIAVQIAKLRAFITLVCDQEPDPKDPANNYGMLPLPNLETKFVAANTLIGLSSDFAEGLKPAEGGSYLDDPELVRLRTDLAEVRHQHFRARNSSDKNTCRRQDRDLRTRIKTRLVEIASKPDADKIAHHQTQIEALKQRRQKFEKEDWRDVVQSQPTQANLFEATPTAVQTMFRMDVNKDQRDKIDDTIHVHSRSIEVEANRAKNKSAFQKEADSLAAWDPYDQNASSPFFDPKWMFDVRTGFDLVLGNPPYVRQEAIKDQKAALQAQGYVSFDGTADLFVYFYERGVNLLEQGGHLSFITSNKYFRAGYGRKLRDFLSSKTRILDLIDFGDAPVFDAIAYPSIILVQRAAAEQTHQLRAFTWALGPQISEFPELFRRNQFSVPQYSLRSKGWQLECQETLALMDKLRGAGSPLGKYVQGGFYYGIKTGLNEAFVVDRDTRDRLIAEHKSSAAVLKPFLRGRDVKRWCTEFAEQYLITIESSENKTHPWSGKSERDAEKCFAATYPAIHARFQDYRVALKKREDQGKYFWELRSCVYWQAFEKPKILYPDIYEHQSFAWDKSGYFAVNTCYFIPTREKWLTGLLNSQTVEWFYSKISNKVRGGYLRAFSDCMQQIPVPIATHTQQAAIATLVDSILEAKANDSAADVSKVESHIDRLVCELYGLADVEIAIVEGREPGVKAISSVPKPAKTPGARQPRKSVMTNDPDLA